MGTDELLEGGELRIGLSEEGLLVFALTECGEGSFLVSELKGFFCDFCFSI